MANNSVTKTFHQDSDMGDLMQWFVDRIPTEDHEIIYNGAEPSMDVQTRLKKKLKITIVEVSEPQPK